jgi:SAM-dependent methyltransferase
MQSYLDDKKSYWDDHHTDVGNVNNYVTETPLKSILEQHSVRIPSNKRVMDIGVGYGRLLYDLKSHNNTVIGVDISQKAIDNIKQFTTEAYLSGDLNKIEPVDIAICHLVMQHNHQYEVARIINDTNLTEDGFMTIQFASLNLEKSVLSKVIANDLNKAMMYFYSKEKMRQIVETTSKKIFAELGPVWFDKPYSFDWNFIKVKNK